MGSLNKATNFLQDVPPSYDDLHELKTPPPPFQETVRVNPRSPEADA